MSRSSVSYTHSKPHIRNVRSHTTCIRCIAECIARYLQIVLEDKLDVAVLGDDARDLLLEARTVFFELWDEVHDLVCLVLELRQLYTQVYTHPHKSP